MDAEELRVEAVVVDYYQSKPLPSYAIKNLPTFPCYLRAREVPVVRIFGATPAGQKTLIHIHGLFPYFYFRAEDDAAFDNLERLRALLPQLAKEIEAAHASTQQQRRQINRQTDGIHCCSRLVAKMLIVQGTPFYGYHPIVQLLESRNVGERRFQAYEAHVPFLLQVFADYNIEGMNCVAFSNVKFRFPVPVTQDHLVETSGEYRVILLPNVPADRINGLDTRASSFAGRSAPVSQAPKRWFDRQSSCALEADVAAACILNPKRFELQQKAAEGTGELRNVPSFAAIWEEERLRKIQQGERGTPPMSLSLPRNVDVSICRSSSMSVSPAQSASSMLSQSFFKDKMKKSVDAVLQALAKQVEGQQINSGSPVCYQPLPARDVVSCGNSIAMESKYSYSQAEIEINGKRETNQSAEEDEAIVDILVAMQQESGPDDADTKGRERNDSDGYNTPNDNGEEENIGKWSNRNDEIVDILASQRVVEKHIASQAPTLPANNGWWNVAERESRSIARPLSDLGSPRVVLRALQTHSQKPSTNAARAIRFGASPEDLPLVGDIEDLLLPRPQEPIPLALEESDQVDCSQLSLTPHLQPLRVTQRVQAPSQAATGNNRLWLFSREPPSFSEIISSSHKLGVNAMQYQPAFYSIAADIPDKAMVFGGKKFDFKPHNASNLLTF
ncbi:unnamed protein product [Peronospora destructor]|uniref:DNA-directed DNA polymerase family B exonuclease domain-containing protein n=1 Tax=Peronospora destructor TaxID=86335 RepID=A0AAV0V957_9STRA|nr:unnamed protein product [Peronospora destructor]